MKRSAIKKFAVPFLAANQGFTVNPGIMCDQKNIANVRFYAADSGLQEANEKAMEINKMFTNFKAYLLPEGLF